MYWCTCNPVYILSLIMYCLNHFLQEIRFTISGHLINKNYVGGRLLKKCPQFLVLSCSFLQPFTLPLMPDWAVSKQKQSWQIEKPCFVILQMWYINDIHVVKYWLVIICMKYLCLPVFITTQFTDDESKLLKHFSQIIVVMFRTFSAFTAACRLFISDVDNESTSSAGCHSVYLCIVMNKFLKTSILIISDKYTLICQREKIM